MARYKVIDTSPRFLAVDLQRQLLPGSFEYALNHLIDHELDLSGFDARYRNDLSGAPAYPDVPLETMALAAHEDQPAAGLGREPEDGDPAWHQQQKLLAHGADSGDAAGVEQ